MAPYYDTSYAILMLPASLFPFLLTKSALLLLYSIQQNKMQNLRLIYFSYLEETVTQVISHTLLPSKKKLSFFNQLPCK